MGKVINAKKSQQYFVYIGYNKRKISPRATSPEERSPIGLDWNDLLPISAEIFSFNHFDVELENNSTVERWIMDDSMLYAVSAGFFFLSVHHQ